MLESTSNATLLDLLDTCTDSVPSMCIAHRKRSSDDAEKTASISISAETISNGCSEVEEGGEEERHNDSDMDESAPKSRRFVG